MATPFLRTSKCRCGPNDRPVFPTLATVSPARTVCPTLALISRQCAYLVSHPSPWSTLSNHPYPASSYERSDTVPLAAARTGVPSFAAMSTPACNRPHRDPNPLVTNGSTPAVAGTGFPNFGCHLSRRGRRLSHAVGLAPRNPAARTAALTPSAAESSAMGPPRPTPDRRAKNARASSPLGSCLHARCRHLALTSSTAPSTSRLASRRRVDPDLASPSPVPSDR